MTMEDYRLDKKMLARDWPVMLVLLAMLAASVRVYPLLPEMVPVHWNAAGQVDGYGSRAFGAFMLPALAAGIYAMMLVLPVVDPRRANYSRFLGAYRAIRWSLVLFLATLHAILLASALGYRVPVERALPVLLGLLFGVIGICMPRLRHNYFVGVRTPWTLASEEVWHRTHRFAGSAYVLAGVVSTTGALLARGAVAFKVVVAAGILASALSVVYSLAIFPRKR